MPTLASIFLLFATAVEAVSSTWPMVGWDAYRNYGFYLLRPHDITREISSYDRKNANDDGFVGTYSCLYNTTAGRCVIAEAQSPGQISSIWFTYANNSVIGVGDIQVELDGHIVLEGIVQDIVNGKKGRPFVWPLVGNVNDTSGGNVIKVPMPYQKSMKISTSNNPHFYHVYYRTFPSDVRVHTFDPKEHADDVWKAMLAFGVADPKSLSVDDFGGMSQTHMETSKTPSTLQISGSGMVDQLQIRIPEIVGAYTVTDDGRAFGKGGSSSFTMRVDPASSRCCITRRLDKTIGHQKASVTVDSQAAGQWQDSGNSENATFYDQVLELKPLFTQGKSSISVKNTFVSSDLDFNEFYYATHCIHASGEDWALTDLLNVGWNNQHDEAAHNYQIAGQTWQGLRQWYHYSGDRASQAQQSIDALDSIYIEMEFDGKQTVSQPIGSFFGVALGKSDVRSLLLSVDTFMENGAFTCWFPMPFSKSTKISLSRSGKPVSANISVNWHEDQKFQSNHCSKEWGYFSTQHRRSETTTGQLWSFLSKSGSGVAYGVTHAIRGFILPPNNTLEFLEGDFQTWYNRTSPGPFKDAAALGTGTEDFYESGWYFADAEVPPYGVTAVPYGMPLTGLTQSEFEVLDCVGECLSPLRLLIPDSLAFDDGVSMNIEHGPVGDNINAEYETTAFYYAV
ncbi:hypothetical protein NA57DRAFT_78579 [Rhizodiscina lignyota]|uniref:DUF2961 domain-containing protein n=1 Tax=Rhizodiscina lignyota TaxID=1504668 RepID=A0A9P4M7G3_9PEZI|nr:hypothetical protein NA57DRAFT_78579 [Rhizodiscina lignyota]